MKREIILKKLHNVNEWVCKARDAKDWTEYEAATKEYARLAAILKTAK